VRPISPRPRVHEQPLTSPPPSPSSELARARLMRRASIILSARARARASAFQRAEEMIKRSTGRFNFVRERRREERGLSGAKRSLLGNCPRLQVQREIHESRGTFHFSSEPSKGFGSIHRSRSIEWRDLIARSHRRSPACRRTRVSETCRVVIAVWPAIWQANSPGVKLSVTRMYEPALEVPHSRY